MTYNKWQDELSNYLGSLNEKEREEVYSYFAEMYADKRDAGLTEEQIVEEFGAPYDAAKRILAEQIGKREQKGEEDAASANPSAPTPAPAPKPAPATPASPAPAPKRRRMRWWKIVLIAVSSAIAFSLAIFLLCLGLNGWKLRIDYANETYTAEGEITTLDLELSAGQMNITFYNGDKVMVEYPSAPKHGYEVSEENGTIKVDPIRTFSFFWQEIPTVTVKIPKTLAPELDLDVSTGLVKIADGAFGKIDIDMSTGSLEVEKISCTSFDLDLSAGAFEVKKLECSGKIVLDLSAGAADFNEVVCNDIRIDLSTGAVDMNILGVKSEYTISVSKSAGSCNVDKQTGTDGNKQLDINLSTGSVDVAFSS